jgi:ABC-2 type transport system permease protein
MTATTPASPATPPVTVSADRPGVPLFRLVRVELRKMFDTRSGFWLMMSIGIIATLATVFAVVFVPDEELGYEVFAGAVGFPMAILLPIVAILCVTGEWSQRTGLITFTLAPQRTTVLLAKALAAVVVGIGSMVLALTIGAIGNVVGSALDGIDTTWNLPVTDVLLIVLANVLGLLVGFMLGVVIRSSSGAIVAYFVYSFVVPTLFAILAATQDWFADARAWLDFNDAQAKLFDPPVGGADWAHLGVSGILWFVLPLAFGVWSVQRSEVK